MSGPILEDPIALGKADECEQCGNPERYCECKSDPDEAYDRIMEDRAYYED